MIRVTLPNVTAHRTCEPRLERHQATPFVIFLDPTETHDCYSGMVVARSGESTVVLCDGAAATQRPFGLLALDRNPVIDDTQGLDNVPLSVWIGAADAMFSVKAPAFDTGGSYAVPTNGTRQLLYAGTGGSLGKLTSASGGGQPVAELMEVVSTTELIVRLLPPGTTP